MLVLFSLHEKVRFQFSLSAIPTYYKTIDDLITKCRFFLNIPYIFKFYSTLLESVQLAEVCTARRELPHPRVQLNYGLLKVIWLLLSSILYSISLFTFLSVCLSFRISQKSHCLLSRCVWLSLICRTSK